MTPEAQLLAHAISLLTNVTNNLESYIQGHYNTIVVLGRDEMQQSVVYARVFIREFDAIYGGERADDFRPHSLNNQ
jgi:hypothetical protein